MTNTAWWFPLPRFATWDKPLALQSVRKLAGLDVSSVATGHGPFVLEGTAAIQSALAKAEDNA